MNLVGCVNEINGVVVVFFDIGGNGKDVWIEDDVGWIEVNVGQYVVGVLVNFYFLFIGVGLVLFVEGYDYYCSVVVYIVFGVFDEFFFVFFQVDGVYYCFVLDVVKIGFNYVLFGGVDYDWNLGDIWFGSYQVKEGDYDFLGF